MLLSRTRHAAPREDARAFAAEQLGILSGLVLLAAVGFAFLSLATWSAGDPSLSSANGNPVRNAGGFLGSCIADLSMQFIGLSSAVALTPPACWAWMSIAQAPIGRMRARSLAILPAIAFACALLALFEAPSGWPLPTGLGGMIGDLALKIPEFLLGERPGGWTGFASATGFALASLYFLLFSSGFGGRPAERGPDRERDEAEREAQAVGFESGEGEGEEEREERVGMTLRILGGLTHAFLSLRARHAARASALREGAGVAGGADAGAFAQERCEPQFEGAGVGQRSDSESRDEFLSAPPDGPAYGEEAHGGRWNDGWDPAPAPARADSPHGQSPTVGPLKERLQPGRRLAREAQSSLIASAEEFSLPALRLLCEAKGANRPASLSGEALERNGRLLKGVLEDFGVRGEVDNIRPGPVVTLYEFEPAPGVKSSRVIGLADDIARSMSAAAARVAVVSGRNALGIELPNERRETVWLRELLASRDYESSKAKLPLVLGKTIGGEPVIADLAKMPHLLVAGTTGSGKSVAINTMILSILYRLSPREAKLILIDPKMLELSTYDGIPHLLSPVVTDPKKAVAALKWTVREMENRYRKMSKLGVRNIDGYNARLEQSRKRGEPPERTVQIGYDPETGEAIYETETLDCESMPYIVLVIDEMADLMMVAGKEIEGAVQRLAQMARAAGIHVIMATQRPSVDVITGTIKANFPTRISFQVTSRIDSRTILGEQGAEQLLGMGDMLYMAGGGRIQRVHGPFVTEGEVEKVADCLRSQGIPEYLDSITEEEEEESSAAESFSSGSEDSSGDLYEQAVSIVLRDKRASTSYVQRRLSVGYNRAASLIERMEREGVISPPNHSGKREILAADPEREAP